MPIQHENINTLCVLSVVCERVSSSHLKRDAFRRRPSQRDSLRYVKYILPPQPPPAPHLSDARGQISNTPNADIALPKATVNKFANEIASSLEVRLTADTRELIASCCSEFVQLLSSEANEICEKDNKKTITPEHVIRALLALGLERFHQEVRDEYERAKTEEKAKSKGASRRDRNKIKSELDSEELLRQQEQLFALARSDPMAMNHSTSQNTDHPPE